MQGDAPNLNTLHPKMGFAALGGPEEIHQQRFRLRSLLGYFFRQAVLEKVHIKITEGLAQIERPDIFGGVVFPDAL